MTIASAERIDSITPGPGGGDKGFITMFSFGDSLFAMFVSPSAVFPFLSFALSVTELSVTGSTLPQIASTSPALAIPESKPPAREDIAVRKRLPNEWPESEPAAGNLY